MKVVINIFGAITAYYAHRSYLESQQRAAVVGYGER
jgi:hypothetical protein